MDRRASRWWDLPAALLLAAALLTASGRLVATEWVDHLDLVRTLALIGMGAGLALGQSAFHPALVALFALLYGSFFVPWQLVTNLSPLSEDALWSDRLIVLGNRLLYALRQVAAQKPVQDPALFLFGMAVLSWVLSVHAGYTLTRRARPWHIILPTGLVTMLVHTSDPYRPRGIWYLAGYLLFSLLLLARLTFLQLRGRWEDDQARIPPLISLDLSYVIVLITVALILLAWTVPTMADVLPAARRIWERATDPWEERADNLFASLERRGATVTAVDYYSDNFPLGLGRELSDALVASVQAPPDSAYSRYYWRARVYDQYQEGGWTTAALTGTERVSGTAYDFPLAELEGRRTITAAFTSPEPLITLYAPPQPLWVSQPVEVDLAENPDGTVDVAALHAKPPVGAGQTYLVRSSISAVTVAQLREAGTDYPDWVMDRYLEVPAAITPRTRALAEGIAEGSENPYETASAVTRYLRDTIRYSEVITGTPSPDQDPLDWFLFDVKVGFCNYYASSEVILLRLLGIPARLAVGFGAGERQVGTNTYLVYERNAHAWPEVYFPGFGWIEFEPTVSEDPLIRPLGDVGAEDEGDSVPPGGDTEDRWRERLAELEGLDEIGPGEGGPVPSPGLLDRLRSSYWLVAIVVVGILVVLSWQARRRISLPVPVLLERGTRRIGWTPPAFLRRWARRALLNPLEKAYVEVDQALLRLGLSPQPADTPAERAAALAHVLPAASAPVSRLLAEYEHATYSPRRAGSIHQAREAARTIRRLSWVAKLRRLVGQA